MARVFAVSMSVVSAASEGSCVLSDKHFTGGDVLRLVGSTTAQECCDGCCSSSKANAWTYIDAAVETHGSCYCKNSHNSTFTKEAALSGYNSGTCGGLSSEDSTALLLADVCQPSTEFNYIIADVATGNHLRELHPPADSDSIAYDQFISAGPATLANDYQKFYFEKTSVGNNWRIHVVKDGRMLHADDTATKFVTTLVQKNDDYNHFTVHAEDGNCANGFVGTVTTVASGNSWQVVEPAGRLWVATTTCAAQASRFRFTPAEKRTTTISV